MNTEKTENLEPVNNDLPIEVKVEEITNMADYYRKNPNVNKRNAITIIVPNREKFIEIQKIVEAGKLEDPNFNSGKLFLQSLEHCQSEGFYLVD